MAKAEDRCSVLAWGGHQNSPSLGLLENGERPASQHCWGLSEAVLSSPEGLKNEWLSGFSSGSVSSPWRGGGGAVWIPGGPPHAGKGGPCQGTQTPRSSLPLPWGGGGVCPTRPGDFRHCLTFPDPLGGSQLPSFPGSCGPNPPQSLCLAELLKLHRSLTWSPGMAGSSLTSQPPVCGKQGMLSARDHCQSETGRGTTA